MLVYPIFIYLQNVSVNKCVNDTHTISNSFNI